MNQPNLSRERASSLVAVFWLIAVLGLVVFGATRFVSVDAKWITSLRTQAQARSLAETGIAFASHPDIEPGDPLLTRMSLGGDVGYRVEVSTEEGLIPINDVLLGGQKPMLSRLFQSWGLDPSSSAALIDAMVDWVDEDDLISLNGAEADAYAAAGLAGFPANKPFESLDEIAQVREMARLIALRPDWQSAFTIWSDGTLDLNEANPEIAAAVLGVPLERAQAIHGRRIGEDGLKNTADDLPFRSVTEALAAYGLPASVDRGFTVAGSTRRIISRGTFHGTEVTLVETRRAEGLLWRREF
ncbi:MAG: hypothetical protein AAF585_24185 [Verrucomicrobiota bacterium]